MRRHGIRSTRRPAWPSPGHGTVSLPHGSRRRSLQQGLVRSWITAGIQVTSSQGRRRQEARNLCRAASQWDHAIHASVCPTDGPREYWAPHSLPLGFGQIKADRVNPRLVGIVVGQEDRAEVAATPMCQPPGCSMFPSRIRVGGGLDIRVLDRDRRWERMPFRVGQGRAKRHSLAVRDPGHAINLGGVVRGPGRG